MSKGRQRVFLDTTFLDALLNPKRAEHTVAVKYFENWMSRGVVVATSTICIAEYAVHAATLHPIFNNITAVPFNVEAGILTGELFRRYKGKTMSVVADKEGARDSLKDDFKIVAAAALFGAKAIAHNDKRTMHLFLAKAIEELQECKGMMSIVLSDGYNAGYANLDVPELDLNI